MKSRSIRLPEAARLFGVNYETAKRWILLGLLPSSRNASPRQEHILDLRGLLAIGLVRLLRSRKVSMPTIGRLTGFLEGVSVDELEQAFARGEVLLVSAGESFPPRLMNPQSIVANRSDQDGLLVAIDLEVTYRHVSSVFSQENAKSSAEPANA
jgi:hypothetical protein